MLATIFKDFKNSIKSPDTEEKLDLFFYRPFGYIIAVSANFLGMNPTMLSLMGLLSGIIASYYFFYADSFSVILIASLYFVLSGVFDSADGQLARISNQSTSIGLIFDGVCDSLVTIIVYFTCSWNLLVEYNYYYLIVVCTALYLHSCQCAILDFYHREYLYFGYGKIEEFTYWNPDISEGESLIQNSISTKEKILNILRLSWIKKQQKMTTRSEGQRKVMRKHFLSISSDEKKIFMNIYKKNNLWLLPFWRLVGVNAHTVLIIFFMLFKRFDIYLIMFDLVIFNLIILIVGQMQKRADQKLFSELRLDV
ncbi:MAG: CDP-alcohol phosphatidyltransferase family protein [Bacteriovorax sp.]|nr:CDP-alcohol phosphatidyltransferase family protein [Bacteriovorax sp.]